VSTEAAQLEPLLPVRRRGVRRHVTAFARTYPGGAVGAVLLALFVALAIGGFALHDHAYDNDPVNRLQPPLWGGGSLEHPLGTDSLGRDVAARIVVAIRISLLVAAASVFVAGVVGVMLGVLAGYSGRWIDDVVMRATDTMLAVPVVLLAITVMTVIEPGIRSLVFVIALAQWMTYARVVRGEALAVKQQLFVTAARAVGARDFRILLRHVMPQVLPSAIALATLNISVVVLLEAGLSYLGLGVQLPDPSLGSLLNEGRQYVNRASWLAIYPGLALLLLVLSINLFGDGLRAYLDPETRK
jgi:peptide/nickel transport system permease protein